jgi:hypothetical protein
MLFCSQEGEALPRPKIEFMFYTIIINEKGEHVMGSSDPTGWEIQTKEPHPLTPSPVWRGGIGEIMCGAGAVKRRRCRLSVFDHCHDLGHIPQDDGSVGGGGGEG